jgi:hypothetical protein
MHGNFDIIFKVKLLKYIAGIVNNREKGGNRLFTDIDRYQIFF